MNCEDKKHSLHTEDKKGTNDGYDGKTKNEN